VKPLTLPDNWADLDNESRRLHVALGSTTDPIVRAALRQHLTRRPLHAAQLPPEGNQPPGRDR
jgi:hypothetical protein